MAEFNTIKVLQSAWYSDTEFTIELPSLWDVSSSSSLFIPVSEYDDVL